MTTRSILHGFRLTSTFRPSGFGEDPWQQQDTHRKPAAILSADVAGCSRLMGADEEATIQTLAAYRKVFVPQVKHHHGIIADAKGDVILAEFGSAVDAVGCAIATQREPGGRAE